MEDKRKPERAASRGFSVNQRAAARKPLQGLLVFVV
jgi:hypothetical protein